MAAINSNEMNFEFDGGSIFGTICTWAITIFGLLTLNEYAVLVGIMVGVSAFGVNVMKMVNQRKESKILDEKIRVLDDDDDE